MNFSKLKLADLLWVGYPLLAVFFIIFSVNYLLGSGENSLQGVMAKKNDSEAEQKTVMDLRTKLDSLNKVNKTIETEKLKKLLVAAPAAKRVWFLLRAINRSASEAGATVKEFSGSAGDIKEASQSATTSAMVADNSSDTDTLMLNVEYETMELPVFNKVIANLEKYLPLVKITKASFGTGKTTLTVEGAWGKFAKTPKVTSLALPEYSNISKKALNDIANLIDLTASDGASLNP